MITERPKSKFEDENGVVNIGGLFTEGETDYPKVKEWDRKYTAECDQVSAEYAAKTGYKCWGRWFLDTRKPVSLVTFSSRAQIADQPKWKGDEYWIEITRIGAHGESDGGKYTWYRHMREKNWMGKQGIIDMKRAIGDLVKDGKIVEKKEAEIAEIESNHMERPRPYRLETAGSLERKKIGAWLEKQVEVQRWDGYDRLVHIPYSLIERLKSGKALE